MRKKPLTSRILAQTKACAPDSTVSLLSYIAMVLFGVYVCCVVLTVYYATLQTELVATIRDTEGGITQLERTYYDGVQLVSSTNPLQEGYVRPTEVQYAQAKPPAGLTFAGR